MKILGKLVRYGKVLWLVGVVLLSANTSLLTKTKVEASSYPWGGAVCVATGQVSGKCPNYEWSYNGQVRNPTTGNYYYRNCTDYVAWRLINSGIPLSKVSGLGGAGSWDDNAPQKGLTVSGVPTPGSAGVDERYGHVVYVDSVSGSTITISEFNWGSTGSYGSRTGTAGQLGLSKFVSFGSSQQSSGSYEQYYSGSGVKSASFLGADRLYPGQVMRANQYIESFNTKYVLLMQPDGNLVEYGGEAFNAVWNTRTSGNPGAYVAYQTDGNLVVYASDGRPLWWSGMRSGSNQLVLQNDGHLVNYNPWHNPLWYTGVHFTDSDVYAGASVINSGGRLMQNQYIRSGDGRYSLRMQADGNLVVYGPGSHALWNTRTSGNPGAYVAYQTDGNLVVYPSDGRPLWWSGMRANSKLLFMQSDGNLVQYDLWWRPLWNVGTNGRL